MSEALTNEAPTSETETSVSRVVLSGEVTTASASSVHAECVALLNLPSLPDVEVDCAQLSRLSVAGIQILLALRRSLEEGGRHLHLREVSNSLRQDFTRAGLWELLEIAAE